MESTAEFLSLIGNEKRLLVLSLLAAGGEISVNDLAERVTLKQNALSHHLTKLRKHRLVETRRDGQTIYYFCDPATAEKINRIIDAGRNLKSEADGERTSSTFAA